MQLEDAKYVMGSVIWEACDHQTFSCRLLVVVVVVIVEVHCHDTFEEIRKCCTNFASVLRGVTNCL